MSRVTIDVAQIEFDEGGKTMWIHNAQGITVLRLRFDGGIRTAIGCSSPSAHADAILDGQLVFCMPGESPACGQ